MATGAEAEATGRVTFSSVLARKDFFRLWLSQGVSLIGDRLTQVALYIYILQLAEGSAAAVGWVMACQALPLILFGPVAGVLVDRWDKRTTLVVSDLLRALIIAVVPLLGDARLVYLIGFLMATVSTVFSPALQATVPELLGRRDEIMVANSLLYSTKFFTDILGFTLAGTIVLATGARVAFLVDSATFVVSALLLVGLSKRFKTASKRFNLAGFWDDLKAGVRYHRENPVVLSLLILFIPGVLAFGGLNALLLVAIDRVLVVDRFWYGYLLATQGVTMFATAVALGKWAQETPKQWLILGGFLVTGLCALALSVTTHLPLAFVVYAVLGIANSIFLVPSISWVQELVPFEIRGRVMALRMMALNLSATCSYVVAGSLADSFGVTPVMAATGLLLVVTAIGATSLPGLGLARKEGAGPRPVSAA